MKERTGKLRSRIERKNEKKGNNSKKRDRKKEEQHKRFNTEMDEVPY